MLYDSIERLIKSRKNEIFNEKSFRYFLLWFFGSQDVKCDEVGWLGDPVTKAGFLNNFACTFG